MASDYDSIEAAIKIFLEERDGARFTGPELLEFLTARLSKKRKKGAREIGEMALDILKSGEDKILCDPATGTFQESGSFFKDALFRATPSKEEIEEGILLPCPRMAFFCNPELCGAEDMTIRPTDVPNGEAVGTKQHALALMNLEESHILLGRNALFDYLMAESNENVANLRGGDPRRAKMELAVFDLADYYKAVKFQEGESLIFQVVDWNSGLYSFHKEAARAAEPERREWMFALERSLARTWADFGDYLEIADQVAAALFSDACAGGTLVQKPAVGLDEAHKLFHDIALVQNGGEWSLVPSSELAETMGKDEVPEDAVKDLAPSDFSVSKGALTEEELLKELKFPYPMPVFQALIFDELANGCESFEEFHTRHLSGLDLNFADDAQEATFLNFTEDLWEESQDRFNPASDEAKAPLRTRILEIARACARTLASIAAKASTNEKDSVLEAYKQHHEKVVMLQHDIVETLALLNNDSPLPEGQEYDDLELRVGDMEELWDSLLEVLEPVAE